MSTIADRLKEERKRLGFNQEDFAALAGITKRPYIEWEKGSTAPDARQLAALTAKGFDVQYVVTGVHSDMALTPDERELLALFRSASLSVKAAAVGALKGGGARISIGGNVTGQIAEGGLVNHGPVNIGNTGRNKK